MVLSARDFKSRHSLNSELSTFNYLSNTIRVIQIDGQPWFVAADVCRALNLSMTGGSTRHLVNLSQDEVSRWRPTTGKTCGKPNAIISESGLYKLIMRSDKPEARKFQDWVTRDVLRRSARTACTWPVRRSTECVFCSAPPLIPTP